MVEDDVEVDEKVTLNVALTRCVVKSDENSAACLKVMLVMVEAKV
jgi:hypothetical protein